VGEGEGGGEETAVTKCGLNPPNTVSAMGAIHLIKNDPGLPSIKPIQPGSEIYRSGYWTIAEDTAAKLIDGKIYFHEKQVASSFFGGIIKEAKLVREGQYDGVVFTFKRDPACIGVKTSQDGWSQEMKIILEQE
jgi:hypothetical protein